MSLQCIQVPDSLVRRNDIVDTLLKVPVEEEEKITLQE